MKTLSFYLLSFVLVLSTSLEAQNLNTWRISFGYSNFSKSNDLLIGNQYSNFNNFNFPNTISFEKRVHNNFSFKFAGMVNEFEKIENAQNLTLNQKNDFFLGLDFALKYSLMGEKGKHTWFNPFIAAGIGYSKFDTFGDTKLTAGVGSNFWIKKNFGFQISSTYNNSVALDDSDYFNHFIGFIVLFSKEFKTDLVENNQVKIKTQSKNKKATEKQTKQNNVNKTIKNKENEETQIVELKKIEQFKSDDQDKINVKKDDKTTSNYNNSNEKDISLSQINIKSENDSIKILTDKIIKSQEKVTSEREKTDTYTSKNLTNINTDETITSKSIKNEPLENENLKPNLTQETT